FIESENNLVNNIDKNVFYLEAPTGGGKTNMSTNIALKIIELTSNTEKPITRFLYTAPFNSITTQTADTLNKLLLNSFIDVTTVNCDNPIPIVDSDEEFKYQLSLIDYQMLNYPITLTSHIKLFQALFGVSRIDNHMLLNMLNSVVIIDEIQAYNPAVWGKMMKLIDVYSKYLNMKFVIMSATLPKIGNLLDNNTRYSINFIILPHTA
ncbi:DEAD/DEAH box helicase, partial [Clostridium saudiense]|nr:DEAD/DEAH box helicase [Clostridium saudiense]